SCREWPQRDGTEQADAQTLGACLVDGRAQDTRHDAVADKKNFGIFGAVALVAGFQLLGQPILGLELLNVSFQIVRLEINGADQVLACLRSSAYCPRLLGD